MVLIICHQVFHITNPNYMSGHRKIANTITSNINIHIQSNHSNLSSVIEHNRTNCRKSSEMTRYKGSGEIHYRATSMKNITSNTTRPGAPSVSRICGVSLGTLSANSRHVQFRSHDIAMRQKSTSWEHKKSGSQLSTHQEQHQPQTLGNRSTSTAAEKTQFGMNSNVAVHRSTHSDNNSNNSNSSKHHDREKNESLTNIATQTETATNAITNNQQIDGRLIPSSKKESGDTVDSLPDIIGSPCSTSQRGVAISSQYDPVTGCRDSRLINIDNDKQNTNIKTPHGFVALIDEIVYQ